MPDEVNPRDKPMTLIEHLEELRQRLVYSVLGLLIATGAGLVFVNPLLRLLLRPTGGMKLTTLTVLEPFLVKVKVAFLFGLGVSMPWIVYQIFAFVSPALTDAERRRVVPLALLSGALVSIGIVFGYVVVLPVSTRWLLAQAGTQFQVLLTANAYISYVLLFLLVVGATFETPLVILSLAALGVVSPQTLRRDRGVRHARLEPGDHVPGGRAHGRPLRIQPRPLPDLHPARSAARPHEHVQRVAPACRRPAGPAARGTHGTPVVWYNGGQDALSGPHRSSCRPPPHGGGSRRPGSPRAVSAASSRGGRARGAPRLYSPDPRAGGGRDAGGSGRGRGGRAPGRPRDPHRGASLPRGGPHGGDAQHVRHELWPPRGAPHPGHLSRDLPAPGADL